MAFQIIDLFIALFLEELFSVFFSDASTSVLFSQPMCVSLTALNQNQEMILGALLSKILLKFLILRWKVFVFCLIAVINR